MARFRALYYPSWNPPVRWLRSMLLFFDQIQVIRPAEVDDPQYHAANQAVFDLIPDAFGEIRRRHYEMELAPRNKKVLTSVLDYIASSQARGNNRQFVIKISPDGNNISVPGYSFLHVSKLNLWMREQLERRSLILTAAEPIFRSAFGTQGFLIVERHACDLILALLADYYGQEHRLVTITDGGVGYIANALNVEPLRRRNLSASNLASAIIRLEIPEKIETLKASDYVSLRERYEELRELFQHVVRQLCDDYHLAEIRNKKQFDAAVHEATQDFCAETDRLRRMEWARRVKRWTVMGLGVLSSFCSLDAGVTVVLGVGVSVGLHIYQSLRETDHVTDKRRAQQLIADVKGELAHPLLLRKITLG
jgi:hypothetical protein